MTHYIEELEKRIEYLELQLKKKEIECNNYLQLINMTNPLLEIYRISYENERFEQSISLSLEHVAASMSASKVFLIKKEQNTFSNPFQSVTSEKIDKSIIKYLNIHKEIPNELIINDKNARFAYVVTINNEEFYLCSINAEKNTDLIYYYNEAYRDILKNYYSHIELKTNCNIDSFTGLYDHGYLNEKVKQIEESNPKSVAYIMIDLFRLKYVNDNFGHETGDEYIQSVANILKRVFQDDLVFRVGGDEFGIICTNKPKEYVINRIKILNTSMNSLIVTDRFGTKIQSRIDIGYDYTEENVNFKQLIYNADTLMNQNKNLYYKSQGIDRRK